MLFRVKVWNQIENRINVLASQCNSYVAIVFGTSRSASSSHTVSHQSLLIAACAQSSAFCKSSRTWITFNRFSVIFEAFVPQFYLCCTHCVVPESPLNHPNSFCGGMFKINAKFDADSLLYSLSHFECDSHRTYMLTQQHLPPPLKSTCSCMHIQSTFLDARLYGWSRT